MKVVQKKVLALLLVFSLVLALAPVVAVGAVSEDKDKDSYEVRYAYTMNTYDSTEKMQKFTAWYENETGEYFYPEYFAGFQMLEDGKLAFLVTDDSDTVKNTVKSIVGEDVSFIKVEHSFNELYRAEKELWESNFAKENASLNTSLNLQENVVDVFIDGDELEQEIVSYSESSLFHVQSNDEWERKMQTVPERIKPLTEEELHSEVSITEKQDFMKAITTIHPGATTIFGSVYGTLSFCALDGSGNRIFITHGHDLNIDNEISISGSTVGKVVKRFYRSTTYPLDFSVVKVNSGIKISNQINSTSVRITNNISSDYTLKSYVGATIYLYGSGIGGETSAVLSVHDYDVDMVCIYLNNNNKIGEGDSGAPIYMKSGTNATLLGIDKGITGSIPWGISLELIKKNYELYVYQKNTEY